MTSAEAVNWLINITADIGKIEHKDLWHYEQALSEIKEMLESEPDRKAIEDEVWELARRIICPSSCCEDSISAHTKEIFNKEGWEIRGIFNDLSYQEAKSMFEAWRKQKDEIRVGDEVEYEYGGEKIRFIVTGVKYSTAYGFRQIMEYEDVSDVGEYCDVDALQKTGRRFPEVEELLKKMRDTE